MLDTQDQSRGPKGDTKRAHTQPGKKREKGPDREGQDRSWPRWASIGRDHGCGLAKSAKSGLGSRHRDLPASVRDEDEGNEGEREVS